MKFIGNIIWVLFGGLVWSIVLAVLGLVLCITIIGVPIGLQLFKMACFVLWPFGKQVKQKSVTGGKTILNIIWLLLFGWEIALGYLATGVLFCVTIIGIPFGLQYFKLATFVLFPLGYSFE